MGEVRVSATITNALDEALARLGLILSDQVRRYDANAIVDRALVHSVIPAHIVRRLGLSVRGQRVLHTDGRKDIVEVTGPVLFEILDRDTLEEALVFGGEVLIGSTVLDKTDVVVDCRKQRIVPNPAHPDQPVTKIK